MSTSSPRHKCIVYRVTLFESPEEKYRGISTTFLESIQKGIGQTYENMKVEIIKRHKDLPNPAVFLINSMIPCPFQETLMPVAKRILVRHVSYLAPSPY